METLRDRAYRHIHAKLLRRELGPGDRLSNRKFAAKIGISLIPVREAIGQLRRTCREHTATIDALEKAASGTCRELMANHIRQGSEGALEAYDDRRMAEATGPPIGLREVLDRTASPESRESE